MRFVLGILILFSTINIFAASVSGKIIDRQTKRPIAGITVGIEKLNLETKTGADGKFLFNENIVQGFYVLHVSDGTYGHTTYDIKVKRDFYFEIELSERLYSTDTGIYKYRSEKISSQQKITQEEIHAYPMRGLGDGLHLMQTLPGVGGGYSLATVPIIRGTNPLLTKYYIDGIPINHPYHYAGAFIPVISSINDQAIDQAVLYKNDAPVWMGDSAGNVIDIETIKPEAPGLTGKVVLDPALPLIPTVAVTGVPDPGWGIVAVARRSATDVMLDIEDNEYSFMDYYTRVSYMYNRQHRFALMFTGSYDEFVRDKNDSKSGYDVEAFMWDFYMRKNFFLETKISRYAQKRDFKNEYTQDAEIYFDPEEYRVFQAVNYGFGNILFKSGYEYTHYANGASSNIGLDSLASGDLFAGESEFGKTEFKIEGDGIALFTDVQFDTRRLWSNAGVRYEYYGVEETHNVGYSTEVGYRFLDEFALYGKAGRFIAHPDMLYYLGAFDDTTGEAEEQSSLDDAITHSFALGSIYNFYDGFALQLEGFYTNFENLHPGVKVVTNDNDEYRKLLQLHKFAYEEDGYNYGLETYIKGSYDRTYDGYISYTIQKTVRNDSTNEMTESLDGIADVSSIDSEFSQTHIFRALGSARWGKWNPSLLFHLYSSLPYSELTSEGSGLLGPTFGQENKERYNMHHRLDGKLNYYHNDFTRFYAEAWNLYFNQENTVADVENNESDKYNDIPFFFWFGLEICF
jgi:hypothetical protein